MKSVFSKIEGAGKVDVMITISYSGEIVVAEQVKQEETLTTENAQQGDKRNIESKNYENTFVLLEDKDGSSKPLILKEAEPKVEGIVIVTEGGDDIVVKEAMSRAAQALLNVPAHKVEILKMKL